MSDDYERWEDPKFRPSYLDVCELAAAAAVDVFNHTREEGRRYEAIETLSLFLERTMDGDKPNALDPMKYFEPFAYAILGRDKMGSRNIKVKDIQNQISLQMGFKLRDLRNFKEIPNWKKEALGWFFGNLSREMIAYGRSDVGKVGA